MRILTLFIVCCLAWLWAGETLRLHAGAALLLGILSAVMLLVPAAFLAAPLSLVRHGRSGWRCLRRLRALLFSDASSPEPSSLHLRMMAGTALLSGIRRGAFVQIAFTPADAGPQVDGPLQDGSLRVLVAADSAKGWSLSNGGASELTWRLGYGATSVEETTRVEEDAFDSRVSLMAPAAVRLALTREARSDLSRVLDRHWDRMLLTWNPLEVRLWRNSLPILEPEVIATAIAALTNALPRIAASAQNLPRALAENVTCGPSGDTRRANLLALHELDAGGSTFAKALAAARLDPDPRVRLACVELAPGPWALSELSTIVLSDAIPIDVRRDAVTHLLMRVSDVTAWPILKQLLQLPSADSQALAAHALKLPLNAEMLDYLSDHLPELRPALVEQVIRLFEHTLSFRFEPALLGQLGSPHPAVRCAAVEALGRLGTSLSLGPLDDLVSDPVVGLAAKSALRAVASRTGLGQAGQVSVADAAHQGAISVLDEGGTLEVAPKRDEGA